MTETTDKVVPIKKATPKKGTAAKKTRKLAAGQKLSDKAQKFSDDQNAKAAGKKGAEADAATAEAGHNEDRDTFERVLGYFGNLQDIQKGITKQTGEKGATIKDILKREQWNRGALQDIRKVFEMPSTARQDYLRTHTLLMGIFMEMGGWKDELGDLLTRLENETKEADISEEGGEASFEQVDTHAEGQPVKKGKVKAAAASDAEEANLDDEGPSE